MQHVPGHPLSTVRPHRLVVVVGTGTDIGKTWVSAHLLRSLRAQGRRVAVRKPVQSYAPDDDPACRDAAVLGAASGEVPEVVCPPHRWYELAMAPPMAAEALGRPSFLVADLADEVHWPDQAIDVGLVETAGGVRSPLAADGDGVSLSVALNPDVVVLVADAGLGTLNMVQLTVAALDAVTAPLVVVLNRFDPSSDLHARNRAWLAAHGRWPVVVFPGDGPALTALIGG